MRYARHNCHTERSERPHKSARITQARGGAHHFDTDVPRRLRGSGRQRTFFIAFARVESNF